MTHSTTASAGACQPMPTFHTSPTPRLQEGPCQHKRAGPDPRGGPLSPATTRCPGGSTKLADGGDQRSPGSRRPIGMTVPAYRAGTGPQPDPLAATARASVDDLFRLHAVDLVRFALMLVGDQSTAEDVVQDAFLGLYRAWARVRDPDAVLGYLRTAVVNGACPGRRSTHPASPASRQAERPLRLPWKIRPLRKIRATGVPRPPMRVRRCGVRPPRFDELRDVIRIHESPTHREQRAVQTRSPCIRRRFWVVRRPALCDRWVTGPVRGLGVGLWEWTRERVRGW
jgi:hypothetical protein